MLKIPILYRYLVREILSTFYLSLFVFTGILFLIRSLKLIDLVINKDVPALDIIIMFSCIIPRFLEVALPMSLLLATIVAFSRLSADSELVVIKATGISLRKLTLPVVILACVAGMLTLCLSAWIRPWANYRLGVGMFQIAKTKASSGLVAGAFNEMGDLTVYARDVNHETKRLESVIIGDKQDEKNPRTFIAKNGHILADSLSRTLTLRLYNGTIQEGFGLNLRFTDFEVNNITVNEDTLVEGGPMKDGKKANEMFLSELIGAINTAEAAKPTTKDDQRELARLLAEYHYRLALPISCICVAIIAMALGIQPARGGKQWGLTANVIMGILVIFVYYILLAVGNAIATQNANIVWPYIWTPNIAFFIIAVVLHWNVTNEKWTAVSEAITDSITKLCERLKLVEGSK